MTDQQLALVDVPPKLTDRQQHAHDALQAAGAEGLHPEEVGAILCEHAGRHNRDDRCRYDGANGLDVLCALRAKGLARYRGRLRVWQSASTPDLAPSFDVEEQEPADFDGAGPVPYGAFPAGF